MGSHRLKPQLRLLSQPVGNLVVLDVELGLISAARFAGGERGAAPNCPDG